MNLPGPCGCKPIKLQLPTHGVPHLSNSEKSIERGNIRTTQPFSQALIVVAPFVPRITSIANLPAGSY